MCKAGHTSMWMLLSNSLTKKVHLPVVFQQVMSGGEWAGSTECKSNKVLSSAL